MANQRPSGLERHRLRTEAGSNRRHALADEAQRLLPRRLHQPLALPHQRPAEPVGRVHHRGQRAPVVAEEAAGLAGRVAV
jgi:hypothetical protein